MDESGAADDDEDEDTTGGKDEDWLDTVVYFLQGDDLLERLPNPHATSGLDYTERVIASGVTAFSVERLSVGGATLVELRLSVGGGDEPVSLRTRVRLGGRL